MNADTERIRPDTTLDLRDSVLAYQQALGNSVAQQTAGLGEFASVHSGLGLPDASTLINVGFDGGVSSLAISYDGNGGRVHEFLNVDVVSTLEAPATIVAPNYYNEAGEQDSEHGVFMRQPVRPLTEPEGQALIADLNELARLAQQG